MISLQPAASLQNESVHRVIAVQCSLWHWRKWTTDT